MNVHELRKAFDQVSESGGKHSAYHAVPRILNDLVVSKFPSISETRAEAARFSYINERINFVEKTILDIGGNTGYFSFDAIVSGAKSVRIYEGDRKLCDIISAVASFAGLSSRIEINNSYFLFDETQDAGDVYDICFLLNVMHHIGDDFGDKNINRIIARSLMLEKINSLANKCRFLVLQIGYIWKGNRDLPLFDKGEKSEIYAFLESGLEGRFRIRHCGVAMQNTASRIEYVDMTMENACRISYFREFLNRPLFILESSVFE